MTDFWLYFTLGFEHVLNWKAYDHVLFLVVLCAAYSFDSWKRLLFLVTLFTVGHSVSLVLANYEVVSVDSGLIECLIPITILVTALYNLFTVRKRQRMAKRGLFYLFTLFFGLIHGFGFATYYKMINEDNALAPLLEFALGVETVQIIIVLVVLVLAFVGQRFLRFTKRDWILVVSSVVIGMVIPMLAASCFAP